jgi:hypothetical protein
MSLCNAESPEVKNILDKIPTGYDISLCPGGKCPRRFLCLRFLAEAVERQDFFGQPPFAADGTCAEYWDARDLFQKSINQKAIENYARIIACDSPSSNNLHWMLAEMRMRISALAEATWDKTKSEKPLIIPPTPEHYVQIHAYFIWRNQNSDPKDMHWLIAEQRLMLQALIERIYVQEAKNVNK